jgi:hypothetical protein
MAVWRLQCVLLFLVVNGCLSVNVVRDFMNALHFDSTARNTPHGERPPALIAFYDSNSVDTLFSTDALNFPDDLAKKVSRSDLLLGVYDVGAQKARTTFEWIEETMDLPKRFGIEASKLPVLALVPAAHAWPNNATALPKIWTADNQLSWRSWVNTEILDKKHESSEWGPSMLLKRDSCEEMEWTRCMNFPKQLPHYSKTNGYLKMKMPAEIQERLLQYYTKHRDKIANVEEWELEACHTNHHEVDMTMVSLDHDMRERDEIGAMVVPILEEWTNTSNLELTAFYGIREYHRGGELHMHIDRVESHAISAILNIAQENMDEDWMLDVVGQDGKWERVAMKAGEMILYESSTV